MLKTQKGDQESTMRCCGREWRANDTGYESKGGLPGGGMKTTMGVGILGKQILQKIKNSENATDDTEFFICWFSKESVLNFPHFECIHLLFSYQLKPYYWLVITGSQEVEYSLWNTTNWNISHLFVLSRDSLLSLPTN